MRLTEARQGVRMLKFTDVFGRWPHVNERADLGAAEAALWVPSDNWSTRDRLHLLLRAERSTTKTIVSAF